MKLGQTTHAKSLRTTALAAVVLATLCWSASAAAEAPPVERRRAVGIDSYVWAIPGYTFVLAPFFHYEVASGLFADVDLAFAPTSGLNQAGVGLGNPTLGVHYAASDARSRLTRFLGVRVGLPLATAGNADSDFAGQFGSTASAYYDPYRFSVEHMPFIGLLGLELHPIAALWLRLPVEPMLLVPTAKQFALRLGVQSRFEIEGRGQNGAGGGLALQAVVGNLFPPGRTNDRAQLAVEPYFAFDNGTVIVRAGVLVAIDDPLGPGGLMTGHFQLGAHLR